jgi:hypothetical protein
LLKFTFLSEASFSGHIQPQKMLDFNSESGFWFWSVEVQIFCCWEEDAERWKLLRRRDEKNGDTFLLELTTKEIARSEGSRVCKQAGSQGGTRLSVCGLQAEQTCTMDKQGAAEI